MPFKQIFVLTLLISLGAGCLPKSDIDLDPRYEGDRPSIGDEETGAVLAPESGADEVAPTDGAAPAPVIVEEETDIPVPSVLQ